MCKRVQCVACGVAVPVEEAAVERYCRECWWGEWPEPEPPAELREWLEGEEQ
jgi:hypothetical protein